MVAFVGVTPEQVQARLAQAMEDGTLAAAIDQANGQIAAMAEGGQVGAEAFAQSIAGKPFYPVEAKPMPESEPVDNHPDAVAARKYVADAQARRPKLNVTRPNPPETATAVPPPAVQYTDGVIDEARRIVNGARAGDYGENSLPAIAALWSTYLGVDLTPRQVAWMMVLLKAVRDQHKPKRDNTVDAIGYLALSEVPA